ncbi:hypothetical protein T484DRAFT_1637905, partial [Baffinella frigidus]
PKPQPLTHHPSPQTPNPEPQTSKPKPQIPHPQTPNRFSTWTSTFVSPRHFLPHFSAPPKPDP